MQIEIHGYNGIKYEATVETPIHTSGDSSGGSRTPGRRTITTIEGHHVEYDKKKEEFIIQHPNGDISGTSNYIPPD